MWLAFLLDYRHHARTPASRDRFLKETGRVMVGGAYLQVGYLALWGLIWLLQDPRARIIACAMLIPITCLGLGRLFFEALRAPRPQL